MSVFWTKNAVKEVVRRHWSGRAATFDTMPTHHPQNAAQREAWRQRIAGWAGDTPLDVLDVGCGTGFLALELAELAHHVCAADFSEAMLEVARAKASEHGLELRFDQADVENLPYPDSAFDLIIERHVIWTLPDPTGALLEWKRVLRHDGRLVLIEGQWATKANPRAAIQPDYQEIQDTLPLYDGASSAELTALIMRSGFRDASEEPLMDSTLWGGPVERERYALIVRP